MAERKVKPADRLDHGPILRQAPALRPRVVPPRMAAARTVLVIEPNPFVLDLYRMALRPLRCMLVQAENGAQALAMAKRMTPDLIVMELFLPGMSGLEVLEAIEAEPALAAVPIIAVSTLAPQEILPEAALADLADFFVKPIDTARLLNAVSRFLV